jgi:hypothetical protein
MSDETVPAGDEQPVAELEAMRQKNAELLSEAKKAKAALKKYDGIDPDEYAALKEAHEQAEAERAKAAGDFEAYKAKLDKRLSEKDAVIADLVKRNENTHREAAALAAINKHGGNATLLRGIVTQALEVESDGDTYTVVAQIEGEKVSPADYVARLKADDEYAGAFSGTGVGGQGSKPATETPGGLGKLVPEGVEYLT